MRNLLKAFIIFFSSLTFAQENINDKVTYSFDYFLEYENNFVEECHGEINSCFEIKYMLTNSKDNSYVLHVHENDEDSFIFMFYDFGKYWSSSIMSKSDFFRAETINLNCNYNKSNEVAHINNGTNKSKSKHMHYNLSDTLIEDIYLKQYAYKTTNKRKRNNKKNVDITYVIETNTGFHLPVIGSESTYLKWKENKVIPNGIPKYEIKHNTKENMFSTNTLVSYHKYQKFLTLNPNCKKNDK